MAKKHYCKDSEHNNENREENEDLEQECGKESYSFNNPLNVIMKKLKELEIDAELEVSVYKAAQNVSENRIEELEKENQRLRELTADIKFENVILKTAATVLENRMEALNAECSNVGNGNEKFPRIITMIEKMKADGRKALRSHPKNGCNFGEKDELENKENEDNAKEDEKETRIKGDKNAFRLSFKKIPESSKLKLNSGKITVITKNYSWRIMDGIDQRPFRHS
ncbi:hypothetical protein Glove_320g159 [Diversispora epigaea]|uniref:Uncharacterized protein n=1 Tax=Diversispora epigaea TaxID=1348612 RepID=A0A397HS02_9GLOM|nr:hypothetical protein Glove_320g159 [Diversispora epigaea]